MGQVFSCNRVRSGFFPMRVAPRSFLLLLVACSARPGPGFAACNIIPPAIQTFRSTFGSIDRPFAGPGDWADLSTDGCTQTAGFPEPPDQLVVSVLFTPPAG